jgi:hypothetical protein
MRIFVLVAAAILWCGTASADGWSLVLFDERNRWLIAAVFLVEYPLAHFLTGGKIIKSAITVVVAKAVSVVAASSAQMWIMSWLKNKIYVAGDFEYGFTIFVLYAVIVFVEGVILLSQQSRGESAKKVFFLTGIVNAITTWLILSYLK